MHKHTQLVLTWCDSFLRIHHSGDINLFNGKFIGTFHDMMFIDLKCSNDLKSKTLTLKGK